MTEADRGTFFEEDEPVADVLAAFERAEKQFTVDTKPEATMTCTECQHQIDQLTRELERRDVDHIEIVDDIRDLQRRCDDLEAQVAWLKERP